MYEILNFFKILIEFCYNVMSLSIVIYGVNITIFEVFVFVFLGSILWAGVIYLIS